MTIFETERLSKRTLKEEDSDGYFDMMGDPNVMNPIPRKAMTREQSNNHLKIFLKNNQVISTFKVKL